MGKWKVKRLAQREREMGSEEKEEWAINKVQGGIPSKFVCALNLIYISDTCTVAASL